MKKIITILAFISNYCFAQQAIDVAELTIKVGASSVEKLYYGFDEGDQIVFSFREVDGKELKEVEIVELPGSSKYMDYETKKIENQTINVLEKGIYMFRFKNANIVKGRICKIKIQRIPASEARIKFNPTVLWRTVFDTTYTVEQEKYLVSSDTVILNITDQTAKVHSQLNLNGSENTFNFNLPDNTIAWSYYIGVDQKGQQAYENATKELAEKAAPILSKMPGYGPTAALALGGVSYLAQLQSGEDIDFYIVEGGNVNLYLAGQPFNYIKKGEVVNDFSSMDSPLKGTFHVCLSNDNAITGVSVMIKITAIQVNQKWDKRQVQKMHVSSKKEPYLKD